MKVDISPNLPPSSSCTAEAPTGSGSDGGGSSVCRRSMRRIMFCLLGRTCCSVYMWPSRFITVRKHALHRSVRVLGQHARMSTAPTDAGAVLRGLGLRSTPQRRAILLAFGAGAREHLSADEVHARASRELPDLGRGTVYATLAEFAEAGLLAAFGTSEPVRYETNTAPHDHFRCRLCLRLFALGMLTATAQSLPRGFTLERIESAPRARARIAPATSAA